MKFISGDVASRSLENLAHNEIVKPDFRRMKKGSRLLYDFVERKIEDEVLDEKLDTLSKLRRKPRGFEDDEYL